ncbi:hypothetical protein D3C84_1150160 [compost metagenome]
MLDSEECLVGCGGGDQCIQNRGFLKNCAENARLIVCGCNDHSVVITRTVLLNREESKRREGVIATCKKREIPVTSAVRALIGSAKHQGSESGCD